MNIPYQALVRPTRPQADFSAAALVGINSLCLGWSVAEHVDRSNLLGFGIRRTDYETGTGEMIRCEWLHGNKRFQFQHNMALGANVSSYIAPFQRFNWNDYTLSPDRSYRYEIYPFFGNPEKPERREPLELLVKPSAARENGVGVFTNRGVTSAHAYLERFETNPNPKDNHIARIWLSRGLKESLIEFIAQAQAGDAIHVAIYEFEDPDVAAALAAATGRGAEVHIVYHAKETGHEKQRQENEHYLSAHNLLNHATPRDQILQISHNKFAILLKQGEPKAVWTGTCNFTFNAFYLQTNMALEIEKPWIAEAFEAYFQILRRNEPVAGRDSAVKQQVEQVIASAEALLNSPEWKIRFSPVSHLHLLDQASELIAQAQSSIFVSAPFGLDQQVVNSLINNDLGVLEYGLSNNTAEKKISELKFRNTRFFVPSKLETYMGKKWDAKAFGKHKIHSKTLVVDPFSNNPKIIVGTANFSSASCVKNDENFFFIEGDQRLAAIITTEFIRMWEHYKNRAFINIIMERQKANNTFRHDDLSGITLKEDGSWSRTAYDPESLSYKFREREVFAGE